MKFACGYPNCHQPATHKFVLELFDTLGEWVGHVPCAALVCEDHSKVMIWENKALLETWHLLCESRVLSGEQPLSDIHTEIYRHSINYRRDDAR